MQYGHHLQHIQAIPISSELFKSLIHYVDITEVCHIRHCTCTAEHKIIPTGSEIKKTAL